MAFDIKLEHDRSSALAHVAAWRPGARTRHKLGVCSIAGGYFGLAHLGYALAYTGGVSAIWLPVGFAVSMLYLGDLSWWPGVAVGDLLLDLQDPSPWGTSLAQTGGNLAEVLIAAILLRRLLGARGRIERLDQLGRLVLAVGAGTLVSATVGTASLRLGDVIGSGDVAITWRTWLLGDTCGALVLVPLALAWRRPPRLPFRPARIAEAIVVMGAVVGMSEIAFATTGPLTYLVLPTLIWAALRFGQQGGTLALALAVAMAVWRTAHNEGPFVTHTIGDAALATQLYLAVAVLTTLCLGGAISERERAAVELAESRRREEERAASERQRIARDLHDSVSQTLFSLSLHARSAQRELVERSAPEDIRLAGALAEVGQLARGALAEMRALIFELRPAALAEEGLVSALSKHAAAVSAREQLAVEVHGPEHRLPLRAPAEEQLYRVGQEALGNVVKHASATHVRIEVERVADGVTLAIRDDGAGFDPQRDYAGHMGLHSMRDRSRELGGRLEIDSAPGGGTTVRVHVPCQR